MENKLPPPDTEHRAIIDSGKEGYNIIVNAVAGSGKTTTGFHFANEINNDILMITYNKSLQYDVENNIQKYGITNISPYTYHALAGIIYNECNTDIHMDNIIKYNTPPKSIISQSIIIIDETQDQSELYYKFIKKLLKDANKKFQLIIMGDVNQVVYKVKGADSRFLSFADEIWKEYGQFKHLHMSTSYRLTKQVAFFINKVMLGKNRITAIKDGPPVDYIIINVYNIFDTTIKPILDSKKYRPDDIFILAPSVKGNDSPIKKIERSLVEYNIKNPKNKYPIYFPSNDDFGGSSHERKGKIAFDTFNSSKGRERKLVLLLSFDSSYYKYNGKDESKSICPDLFYVAASRAKEKLIVFHHYKHDYLPFLKTQNLYNNNIKIITNNPLEITDIKEKEYINTSPTKLVEYLTNDFSIYYDKVRDSVFNIINKKEELITLPSYIEKDGLVENVSSINGLIIPAMYQARCNNGTVSSIFKEIKSKIAEEDNSILNKELAKIKGKCNKIEEFCHLYAVYYSWREKINHKLIQIGKFDWLKNHENDVEKCINRLGSFIKDTTDLHFEIKISSEIDDNYEKINKWIKHHLGENFGNYVITAYIDVIKNLDTIELKCVNELKPEHELQLILYYWIYSICYPKCDKLRFILFNLCTNEIKELDISKKDLLNEIICKLLLSKKEKNLLSDEDFIQKCLKFNPDKIETVNRMKEISDNYILLQIKLLLEEHHLDYQNNDSKENLLAKFRPLKF
uniref:Uncharacterized protein n=1 Tax=viral metagenome TaxID=1070528 RepID=A0A6C0KWS9_9ZZZZ